MLFYAKKGLTERRESSSLVCIPEPGAMMGDLVVNDALALI